MHLVFGQIIQLKENFRNWVANNPKEATVDFIEFSNNKNIQIADNVSDYAVNAAIASLAAAPLTGGESLVVTGALGTITTVADAVSFVGKGINFACFDGSGVELGKQFVTVGIDLVGGKIASSATNKFAVRTGLKVGSKFRGGKYISKLNPAYKTGQFIPNELSNSINKGLGAGTSGLINNRINLLYETNGAMQQ